MTYGTNPTTTKRLGKRVQQAATIRVGSQKHRDHIKEAEEETKLKEVTRSLQMAHDPRYKVIDHYKECESTRLDVMVGAFGSKTPRLYPEPWGMPEPLGRRSMYHVPVEGEDDDARELAEAECHGFKDLTLAKFQGRIGWEESFKSNVKQLMVDFKLSDAPNCRLNHLERMHHWFGREGKKQTRKEVASPNFLMYEKNSVPLPGSTRIVAPPSDQLTLELAGIMRTPAKQRVERHFGVVPGGSASRAAQTPATPRGGYK